MADQEEGLASGVMEAIKKRRDQKPPEETDNATMQAPGEGAGVFMVDGGMFPSLSGKKVGDVDYLPVKIVSISGRMFKMVPFKDDEMSGGVPENDQAPKEISPSKTGQEPGMF